MPETKATILIPDISGFTEFMTTTELEHSGHALNYLIEAIINAVGDEYEVSEIEGDAVLLIRKGAAPTKKEIFDICIKIYNAFHFQRKWMQLHTVCPCGACQAIINLTLKFVAHHGPLIDLKIGKFIKPSGPEMIIAHRLLKNSINSNEYVLVTEKLLEKIGEPVDGNEMQWSSSSEEYPSIGKVNYQFALLSEARKNVPEPPEPPDYDRNDEGTYFNIEIEGDYFEVYMILKEIPDRTNWVPGLIKVEQEIPVVHIGNTHRCTYENFTAMVTPVRMIPTDEGVVLAESFKVDELGLSLIYEYAIKKLEDKKCSLGCRFLNINESPLSPEMNNNLLHQLQLMVQRLKSYCESTFETA